MKNIEKKLRRIVNPLSLKVLLTFLGILSFLVLLSIYDKEILKQIEVYDIAAWVTTIENLMSPFFLLIGYPVVKVIVWILFVTILFVTVCKLTLRPKAIIINHSSFSNAQATYDKNITKGFLVKHQDINLVDLMKNQKIVDAICTQDRLINNILANSDEYTELFYYGVSHIPLIFRAGFQIGDEGNVHLLHKYRNKQSVFEEILTEDDYRLKIKRNFYCSNKDSEEMLVIIATSFPVSSKDLKTFKNDTIGYKLSFTLSEKAFYGTDSVVSYAVMNRLRSKILENIRNVVADKNIKKIHLVLASSSDFTFFISQGFSMYHDPEIIVYQYERDNPQKYPWGISNKALPEAALILRDKN